MRLMNIASGSSGNATYVGNDHTHILVDSGISRKRISEGLNRLGLTIDDLTAILVTHEHSDHIASLGMIEKKNDIPVFTTGGTAYFISRRGCLEGKTDLINIIAADTEFNIGDIRIRAFNTSHDAAEPVCFRFDENHKSCAIVTDLGKYGPYLTDRLKGLSVLMIEANHDLRMLETGPYPYPLKLRIAGDRGHLSNECSGKMMAGLLHDNMQRIILGHLSEKNNMPEIARMTVENEIESFGVYHSSDFRIDVAGQTCGTEIISF